MPNNLPPETEEVIRKILALPSEERLKILEHLAREGFVITIKLSIDPEDFTLHESILLQTKEEAAESDHG
jgi:hypothetical protein